MNFLILIFLSIGTWAQELNLMTLNLHGYHPMGEERRFETQRESKTLLWSHIHLFNQEEILRGLERRQIQLVADLKALKPDILFLQEVGGGKIDGRKSCQDFYQWNTAHDLNLRLNDFQFFPGCRGNIGWITNPDTISKDIITENNNLVFARGSMPYPQGVMIEGTAILTSAKIIIQDHFIQHLPINRSQESFFFQGIKFSTTKQPNFWWIAINVHGGHKIQNFEQAVTARHFITQYINKQGKPGFKGLIVAGDFNAHDPNEEVSTVPWDFDNRWQTDSLLNQELTAMNRSGYKPFATLPEHEAQIRSSEAVKKLFDWFALSRQDFDESLTESFDAKKCSKDKFKSLSPFCNWPDKIDHIFLSKSIEVKEVTGLYQQNNWTDLKKTRSDHPSLWTKIKL
jgi:hypothetical protein